MALTANAHAQGCLIRQQCANPRPFTAVQQPVRRASRHNCTCSARPSPETFDRRDAMLSMAAAAAVLNLQPAQADGGKHQHNSVLALVMSFPCNPVGLPVQKLRLCMAKLRRPRAMEGMEGMQKKGPSKYSPDRPCNFCYTPSSLLHIIVSEARSSCSLATPGKMCCSKCRYTFEYPAAWKVDVVNKASMYWEP